MFSISCIWSIENINSGIYLEWVKISSQNDKNVRKKPGQSVTFCLMSPRTWKQKMQENIGVFPETRECRWFTYWQVGPQSSMFFAVWRISQTLEPKYLTSHPGKGKSSQLAVNTRNFITHAVMTDFGNWHIPQVCQRCCWHVAHSKRDDCRKNLVKLDQTMLVAQRSWNQGQVMTHFGTSKTEPSTLPGHPNTNNDIPTTRTNLGPDRMSWVAACLFCRAQAGAASAQNPVRHIVRSLT